MSRKVNALSGFVARQQSAWLQGCCGAGIRDSLRKARRRPDCSGRPPGVSRERV